MRQPSAARPSGLVPSLSTSLASGDMCPVASDRTRAIGPRISAMMSIVCLSSLVSGQRSLNGSGSNPARWRPPPLRPPRSCSPRRGPVAPCWSPWPPTRPPVASGPGAHARYARSPKPPPGADGRLRGARARPSRFVAPLSVEASTIDAVRDRETYRRRLVAAVRRSISCAGRPDDQTKEYRDRDWLRSSRL
jgi:hypothetical protein